MNIKCVFNMFVEQQTDVKPDICVSLLLVHICSTSNPEPARKSKMCSKLAFEGSVEGGTAFLIDL